MRMGTWEARALSANTAAAATESTPPAIVVTSIHARVLIGVESALPAAVARGAQYSRDWRWLRPPDERGHPPGRALPPVGEEARGIGEGAEASAEHARHAQQGETPPRQRVEVGEPLAGRVGRERGVARRVAPDEGIAHVGSHHERARTDPGSEEREHVRG